MLGDIGKKSVGDERHRDIVLQPTYLHSRLIDGDSARIQLRKQGEENTYNHLDNFIFFIFYFLVFIFSFWLGERDSSHCEGMVHLNQVTFGV